MVPSSWFSEGLSFCQYIVTVSALKGDQSPGLSPVHSWYVVINEAGEYPEKVVHLHKPILGTDTGPNAFSTILGCAQAPQDSAQLWKEWPWVD